MEFLQNDGGRAAAGYKGDAGDCVVRAIAIATETPYETVYDDLRAARTLYADNHNDRAAKRIRHFGSTPRNGTHRIVYEKYLHNKGWRFTPTMAIGQGCKTHLRPEELPAGRIIVRLSRHLAAVTDGVLEDTYEDSRNGTRCVYGYYSKRI